MRFTSQKAQFVKNVFFFISLICSSWSIQLAAQQIEYDDYLISFEEQNTTHRIFAFYKDKKGFVWIATEYELDRYDGYGIKSYKKEDFGLQKSNIRKIVEDKLGNIWLFYCDGISFNLVKTISGIDVFNPIDETVESFEEYFKGDVPFKLDELRDIKVLDDHKRIWLATNTGQLFLHHNGAFKKVFEQKGATIEYLTVQDENTIWLGLEGIILRIDKSGTVVDSINTEHRLKGIWVGEEEKIWFATIDNSIYSYHTKRQEIKPFYFNTNRESSVSMPMYIYRDKRGWWWLEYQKRLIVYDEYGKLISAVSNNITEGFNVGSFCLTEEEEKIWFASLKGLVKIYFRKNLFSKIIDQESVIHLRAITESDEGDVYFLNKHLYRWDGHLGEVTELLKRGEYALMYDSGNLWFEHRDRMIMCLNLNTGEKTLYPRTRGKYVFDILKTDDPNIILLGTVKGLEYIDKSQQKILPFFDAAVCSPKDSLLDKTKIYFLHKNEYGFWAVTPYGIFLFNKEKGVLRHYTRAQGDLPYNNIRHIYEDSAGVFWLSSAGGGIIRWQPGIKPSQNCTYKQLTQRDGLSNDYIYAVYEDDFKRLWIPSDKGLMCMDKETFQVRTFLTEDGLSHNEFNYISHYKAKDGTLYFGGLGNLIFFHPNEFQYSITNPAQLGIRNYYVLEGDNTDLTDKTVQLNKTKEIIIHPTDKLHELEFVLLDHNTPKYHQYAYQIEGYSNQWIRIKENNIRITNLPYGKYTLKIKGYHVSHGWTEDTLEFSVFVQKPLYLQNWFLAIAMMAFAGSLMGLIKWRERRLKKERETLEVEVQKRTKTIAEQAEALKALDKAKNHFFSNITHEFRTPLTLIIGPLEQLLDKQMPTAIFKKRVDGMLRNARQLLHLINQMLDLTKIEEGKMLIEASQGDIVAYTQELVNLFVPIAQKNGQRLSFVSKLDTWITNFDKDKWDKIFFNLLSNAVKFSALNDAIQVSLMQMEKGGKVYIRLDVRDTGPGIDKEQLEQVFNRFHQVDGSATRKEGGTGIGLALVKEMVELQGGEIWVSSEVNVGTSFEVYLPVLSEEHHTKALVGKPLNNLGDITFSNEERKAFTSVTASNVAERVEVLIIEDNQEMREYIRYCIDPSKYNISEASNGKDGILKAQAIIPDLVISDVMMPQKDGFEVVQTIRSHITTSHIPVILLTAKSSLESRLAGFKHGADAYLTKPFSVKELTLRIDKLIEQRHLLQQYYQNGLLSSGETPSRPEDEFISRLKKFILENIDNQHLNGDYIGQYFGMSRVHLFRKLKALTNQSVTEFVRTLRLQKAKRLLQEGQLNISEIAYQTGFSSASHFSRTFKKVYGEPPSELKRKNK